MTNLYLLSNMSPGYFSPESTSLPWLLYLSIPMAVILVVALMVGDIWGIFKPTAKPHLHPLHKTPHGLAYINDEEKKSRGKPQMDLIWVEFPEGTNHMLPDGEIVIMGLNNTFIVDHLDPSGSRLHKLAQNNGTMCWTSINLYGTLFNGYLNHLDMNTPMFMDPLGQRSIRPFPVRGLTWYRLSRTHRITSCGVPIFMAGCIVPIREGYPGPSLHR